MMHVRLGLRAILLVSALGTFSMLGGCSDTALTGPAARKPAPGISRDDTPPDLPCDGGWVLIDGRWVCAP